MNKKLNAFLRILTVVAAGAAVVFAILLKGKMDVALTNTAWAVTDAEVKAGKEYDARMASLSSVGPLLAVKRKTITDLELEKKDFIADVADKKTKIEGLTAANTTLEGERAELTRKRDELAAQLTDSNSKKDGAEAALASAKEELVKATFQTLVGDKFSEKLWRRAVHDGLHVLDGAILPGALGVNPMATIAAVSIRAARRIARALDAQAGRRLVAPPAAGPWAVRVRPRADRPQDLPIGAADGGVGARAPVVMPG
jgi:hypothetical protein